MTAESAIGILSVFNDCAPGEEQDYETWYQHEHLPERLSVPGFIRGRRYQAIDANRQFFTYYEVESPAVLVSPAYRQRLDNPSAMTRHIMAGVFTNMVRTIGRRSWQSGTGRGSHAIVVTGINREQAIALAGPHLGTAGLARAEYWQTESDLDKPSAEEQLRGGDQRIDSCLFIELLRAEDLSSMRSMLALAQGAQVQTYKLLSELTRQDLQAGTDDKPD